MALSLVLSLLRFKPAPLYILDEIDSALDPSHTQNIGKMIKAHFREAQFLIVSLKEGMFNNANVIFRVWLDKTTSRSQVFRRMPALGIGEQPAHVEPPAQAAPAAAKGGKAKGKAAAAATERPALELMAGN